MTIIVFRGPRFVASQTDGRIEDDENNRPSTLATLYFVPIFTSRVFSTVSRERRLGGCIYEVGREGGREGGR